MTQPEIYVSTDIEADGPIPGPHSMLSLGSAAFLADKTLVATFEVNLEPLDGAAPHPDTMRWWEGFPDAWAAARSDPRPVADAMREYGAWLDALPGRPVFVGYPAGFDFTFVRWYLMRFAGRCPFGFAALDVKSYAMAVLGTRFRDTTKRAMPRLWFDRKRHTHRALDDAIEQGELFCNMLAVRRGQAPEAVEVPAFELVGTDDERFAVAVVGSSGDVGELACRAEVQVGGLQADVAATVRADELTAFWLELRALRDGTDDHAVLEPSSGSPFVELRAQRDGAFAARVRIRDPEIAGQEMVARFVVDPRACDAAIDGLGHVVDAYPASGTELWD